MQHSHILSTNHTSFTVSDLDKAIRFFVEGLGFALISKEPRDPKAVAHITGVSGADIIVAYVQGPGHRIELIAYLAPAQKAEKTPRPNAIGSAHIAFDVDDVDAVIARAAAFDVHPYNSPWVIDRGPNRGCRVVYLWSPLGFTLELIEVKPAS